MYPILFQAGDTGKLSVAVWRLRDPLMKIASWNVNSLRVRLSHILSWLETNQPSVLGLQETKVTDDLFPQQALAEAGYEVVYAGQKTYNGVALMAKRAPVDIVTDLPGFEDPQRRVLAATVDKFRIINLYVPNGQAVGTEKYEYKLNWLLALRDFLEDQLKEHENIVVMGDFNIAPEDRDVHNPKAWEGSVLCSEPERAALRKIADLGFVDTFRLFEQKENTFSWWDYRAAAFRRNLGLRIDLILASPPLEPACTRSIVDCEPRTWDKPSDHAPVLAEFTLSK